MTDIEHTIDDAKLERLNLRNSFTVAPPPLDLVLPAMIAGTVGALVAQGGVGKSFIALEQAIAVAGGPDLLDMGIEKTGPALYLPAEDPKIALLHRLYDAAPLKGLLQSSNLAQ